MKLRAFPSDYGFAFNIYVVREIGDKRMVAPPIDEATLVDQGDGHLAPPTTRMAMEDASQLMDDLWAAGIRPSRRRQEDYGAQSKHLEDMRAIAFGKLGIAKP